MFLAPYPPPRHSFLSRSHAAEFSGEFPKNQTKVYHLYNRRHLFLVNSFKSIRPALSAYSQLYFWCTEHILTLSAELPLPYPPEPFPHFLAHL